MSKTTQADGVREKLLASASGLRLQIDLLDQLIRADRLEWARETLITIKRLAEKEEGAGTGASPGSGANSGAGAKPGRRKWVPATPGQIKAVLNKMLASRPPVASDGPIVVMSFNGYLLNSDKAATYVEPLVELVKRAHIVLVQESNVDALRLVARAAHYGLNASHRNTREQACGILFHPRFQWLGKEPVYHDYLLEVPGHPEFKVTLRPALQRRVKDLASGMIFDLVNFHGKSNVGGPDETRPIRRHQFVQLVAELTRQLKKSPYEPRVLPEAKEGDKAGEKKASAFVDFSGEELPLGITILGGDFNAPIERDTTTEIEPLTEFGFARVPSTGNQWSYRFRTEGGQFDGFFTRGIDAARLSSWIPEFPETKLDQAIYRDFSDHLPVFLDITPEPAKAPAVDAETPAGGDAARETTEG